MLLAPEVSSAGKPSSSYDQRGNLAPIPQPTDPCSWLQKRFSSSDVAQKPGEKLSGVRAVACCVSLVGADCLQKYNLQLGHEQHRSSQSIMKSKCSA